MTNIQDDVNMQEILELGKLLHQKGDKVLNALSKLSLSTSLLHNLNEAFSLIVNDPEDLEVSFQIKGLRGVRGQLERVICVGQKGDCTVGQLLVNCGGDASIGFVWASLKYLTLSHNALEKLDTSLELAPWLQIIDLSHNLITSADELSCLPHLQCVNLGYNKLEAIPTFNKASYSLQVLVLKNNYIENLNGLQHLQCLRELDLSYNCLMQHSTLWPLEKMSALLWISLEGNPLSYHPKHRLLCIKYLRACLYDSKFVLDNVPLSKSEKQNIAKNRLFTLRSEQSTSSEFFSSMSNSLYSVNTSTVGEFVAGTSADGDIAERSSVKSARKSNLKEAVIIEDEQEKKESTDDSDICSSYLGTSKDHLETKKQILALRKEYGKDKWLSSHSGTFVQSIMGLPPLSSAVSTPESTMKNLNGTNIQESPIVVMENAQIETNENSEFLTEENSKISDKKEDQSEVLNEENITEASLIDDVINTLVEVPQSLYNPEEETGNLYLVQVKKNENEVEGLFLIITTDDIKERDEITGKLKYSWSTSSVLSCVLNRSEPVSVDIIFDTVRESGKNRRYFVEPDIAKEIVNVISERMKMRSILLKVFKCMKCSTHFSQDLEYISVKSLSLSGTKQLRCPTCDSTLVIETDELSPLDAENDISEGSSECLTKNQYSENTVKPNLQHSESFSSIGSATSLEESRESTPSTNALNKKYESDIEVLSNPSQSSIEVLDDASRTHLTPHRKRSSEERRTAVAPSLLTIPDAAPIMTGLTESSSSGSLTDSICTAYENKIIKQVNAEEKSFNSNDKEMKFTPVTNLTSMLGGLLQSIKIGSNKPIMLKAEEAPNFLCSDIQYSYTDFSSLDHRIKLHIILNIFEHDKEELIFLLRAEIFMQNMNDTFPGCLVLSTSRVYVLKISGSEGEDPQRWLHKEVSWTAGRLRCFAPLPFKQGLVIELEQPNKANEDLSATITFLCILQDCQRTSNFLFYITELSLPPSCEVEFSVPEHCTTLMHNLVQNCKNHQDGDSMRLLALFSSASLKHQNLEDQLKLSSLIVTTSVLVICNMQWLLPGNKEAPRVIREQAMSNLIGVKHHSSSLTLNFLDEVIDQEETWVLNFVSVSAAETVINSIQPPWEELFSIPLQITVCKSQESENE
ncbi:Serine/threonine-protein kinase 11-interacting protein [Anthophora quadrimaculata]